MENVNLDRFSRPGPFEYRRPSREVAYINTACDICDKYEAVVKFEGTKHCEECAAEIGVELL